MPKAENVRLAAWPQRHNNPSWLHEIALMHASTPDPQPRWRCVQCWDLAYALWSDVAHTISIYTLLLYSQGYAFQGFVKQPLLSVCASHPNGRPLIVQYCRELKYLKVLHGIIADRHLSLFAADVAFATSHRWCVSRGAHDSQFVTTDPKSACTHLLLYVTAVRTW